MILDKLLFEQISSIGQSLLAKAGLNSAPQNIEEMERFLICAKKAYENNEFDGMLLANILFCFVSSIEVRDRHTTARTFEDIFSSLFSTKATDSSKRMNPVPPKEIINLDRHNSNNDNWKISQDLAGNKREKADIKIGNYQISLKTLKGVAFDKNGALLPRKITSKNGEEFENKQNNELNVGSLSFRALLKGIISDGELNELGDRKKGLGSGGAVRICMLDRIKYFDMVDAFKYRLNLFLNYVYEDDIYIALKSHYTIKWILIPSHSFIQTILTTYEQDEQEFEKIWYRWENNNLRLNWVELIKKMNKYGFSYKEIEYNLGGSVHSKEMEIFKNNISSKIQEEIEKMLKK